MDRSIQMKMFRLGMRLTEKAKHSADGGQIREQIEGERKKKERKER